jgi:hypothetical protein
MAQTLAIVLLSVGLLAVGCALQSPNTNKRAGDMLLTQLEADWKYWMTQYPELATLCGYPGPNMRWTDYSQTN